MIAADLLHANVHPIVLSGAQSRCLSPCRRACRAGAFAPHFAQPSNVQASRLERARPMAVGTFPGALAASSLAAPGRRSLERERQAKAEGKTKGGGTRPPEIPVCTWGWRGTVRLRLRAAQSAKPAPIPAWPRAAHDQTRHSFIGERA
jgi:hypothetical protein